LWSRRRKVEDVDAEARGNVIMLIRELCTYTNVESIFRKSPTKIPEEPCIEREERERRERERVCVCVCEREREKREREERDGEEALGSSSWRERARAQETKIQSRARTHEYARENLSILACLPVSVLAPEI
jgi:hypothetical protein